MNFILSFICVISLSIHMYLAYILNMGLQEDLMVAGQIGMLISVLAFIVPFIAVLHIEPKWVRNLLN
jgi:hypothetical protein